jgi:hypothetical protein
MYESGRFADMRKLIVFCICFLFTGYSLVFAQKETDKIKKDIKGVIKGEKGEKIPFASVKINNDANVIIADSAGNFSCKALPNTEISITHVGYQPASFNTGNRAMFTVVMKAADKDLKEVVVQHNTSHAMEAPMETNAANSQIIAQTLNDFFTTQNISFRPGVIERAGAKSSVDNVHFLSASPSGNFYMGSLVPVFKLQEETVGSKYLLSDWSEGVVVDSGNNVIKNDFQKYNYDKVAQTLVLTQDKKTMVEVNKDQLKGFALKNSVGSNYIFLKIPLISENSFLQQLAFSEKNYLLYKLIKTHYEKANYHSDGLTESGKDYNEYVDNATYFIVFPDKQSFRTIELKKKAIKDVLNKDIKKVNKYFSDHNDEFVTESFLVGLVNYLNQS